MCVAVCTYHLHAAHHPNINNQVPARARRQLPTSAVHSTDDVLMMYCSGWQLQAPLIPNFPAVLQQLTTTLSHLVCCLAACLPPPPPRHVGVGWKHVLACPASRNSSSTAAVALVVANCISSGMGHGA
jgi:hypothetical protein